MFVINLFLVSENHILHQSNSPLEYLTELTKKYQITIEQVLILFNGFVHVLRLALKPPAALLKADVI